MNNPLVSIIIPTYNRAHLIGETLDSVLAQTYKNWECIIVDDGSTDNTAEVVGEYVDKDSRFHFNQRPNGRPKGANACRNYGFEISKGEYVNWFDSDDLMMPQKLELNIKEFVKNPNLEMCFSQANYTNLDSEGNIKTTNSKTNNIFKDYVLKNISISCQVPMWKKSFLKETNLFNEFTLRGQEFEFYSEILYAKKVIYTAIDIPLVMIRVHQNSITSDFNRFEKRMLESYVTVTNGVLKKVSKLNDPIFYIEYTKILYNDIYKYIRGKQYSVALNQSKSILKNSKANYFHFFRNHLIFCVIVLLQGKGYHKLKKMIK